MGQRPSTLRDAGRTDFQLLGPPRLRPCYRYIREWKHAGQEWRRVFDARRTAEVLGAVRPGRLQDEAEPERQHGPALGRRLARQGPDREVSLADAPGWLRP